LGGGGPGQKTNLLGGMGQNRWGLRKGERGGCTGGRPDWAPKVSNVRTKGGSGKTSYALGPAKGIGGANARNRKTVNERGVRVKKDMTEGN